jgi:alkylhydroperoxidase family enzyme
MRVNARHWLCLAAACLSLSFAARAQTTVEPPGSRQPLALKTPRIAVLPETEWTDAHRQLVTTFAAYGPPDNAFATLLRLPAMVEGLMPYTIYLSDESGLSPRHRELLILRTAWLNGNHPLWARHAPRARKTGITDSELRRIAQGPDMPGWVPFEATLMRTADQLYRNSSVTDATWGALSAEYGQFQMMDAVETVNHFTAVSLVYNSFGIQPDAGATDRFPVDVQYRVAVPPREPPLKTPRVVAPAGRGIAVGRTFGLYPALSRRWSPRQTFVNRVSKLSPRHREMLILRMGWNCRSEYEWAQHVGVVGRARDHGLEPIRIAEGAAATGWDAFEQSLLRVPDELYRDGIVSDLTWKALAERFDPAMLMSAVFTPSAYRAISMSLNAYGVPLEPGDERFPDVPGR